MKQIYEENYTNYSIVGRGWMLTVCTLGKALSEWNNLKGEGFALYGNRIDGEQDLLESK